MKNKTNKSEKAEAPKSRNQPKDVLKGKMKGLGKPVMVGGAMRPKKMFQGKMTMGTSGTARGMGAAVKGGKFRDL
jgi:hypothetical protein